MATECEFLPNHSKKAAFHITKFQYHLTHTVPVLFPESPNSILQEKKGHKKMNFNYATWITEGVSAIDSEAILESARKLYLGPDCLKLNEHAYRRSTTHRLPYLPISGQFNEIIEFHLVAKVDESSRLTRSKLPLSNAKIPEEEPVLRSARKPKGHNFELYIIHHCHHDHREGNNGLPWQNFVEKYHFTDDGSDQNKPKIHYSLFFNYEEAQGILEMGQTPRLYDLFLSAYVQDKGKSLQNVEKFQGFLLLSSERVDRKLKELNDPCFQQSHKRWLRLPTEHYKQFSILKKQAVTQFRQLNGDREVGESFLGNLVCRYMHAKEYNYKQVLQSVTEYLKWQQRVWGSCNLTMFAQYHQLDFFTYLGQDLEGRVAVLNKACHLNVNLIPDANQYCQYYIYYLQIHLQRKMRGHCDQYTVLVDLINLGSDNFKLAITKRNIADSLGYSPERQYKLITVNASMFANAVWGILKPLLPKRTLSKINIIGTDPKEIIEALTKEMDISVIPEYLGGTNTRVFNDELKEEQERLKQIEEKQI